MVTVEALVRETFGCEHEPSEHQFTQHDFYGVVGHVGLDRREVRFVSGEILAVAAIRFVVVREGCRRNWIGSELMEDAHHAARELGLPFAVAFTDVPEFFAACSYLIVRPRAAVLSIGGSTWPAGDWQTIGPEW